MPSAVIRARGAAPLLGAAAAVVAAAVLSACGRGTVSIESVRVSEPADAASMAEAGIDRGAVETAVREGLAGAGFRLGGGRGRVYHARATLTALRVVPAAGGQARLEAALEIELAPAGPPGSGESVREAGVGAQALEGTSPAQAFHAALEAAARDAAAGLALGFAEAGKGEAALVADLSSRDARVRTRAVRLLGERGATGAVPGLLERLRDPDPSVQHAAVGALARIRDPRAVGPIIDLSRRGDPAMAARLARIVGDIGGPEAEGYLLTLESGHPDPRVRRAAHEALSEMQSRASEARGAARR
ncbi:MAG TPA: HEAT repeat domain-containing protein [Anaeromyxobacteraceae bacterium]|nr:HEAT repeat domain-containing protein [Anaeromyxobacteraceae bacterium]